MVRMVVLLFILLPAVAAAQTDSSLDVDSAAGNAPMSSAWQHRSLIDIPTAGALHKGEYDFEVRMFGNGGVLLGFSVGLFSRLNMGVYYGGVEVLGDSKKMEGNEQPGVEVRYRLFEEVMLFPALTIGYSSQGYGQWMENDSTGAKRYRYKSRGFFAVASKNLIIMNKLLGVHGGVNLNTIERDDDKGPDAFAGLDFGLNEELCLLLEYDLGLNDNNDDAFGEGSGYLNAGIRWSFSDYLIFQFNFKDLLGNSRFSDSAEREIKIVYSQKI